MTNINSRTLGNSNLNPMLRELLLPTVDPLMAIYYSHEDILRERALNFFPVALIKHSDLMKLRRKGSCHLTGHSLTLREIRAGTEEGIWKQKPWGNSVC